MTPPAVGSHKAMFPPVHPGLAYLVYAAYTRLEAGGPPEDLPTLALVAGAVLPDLVDQPLYYALGLPSTRTIGHSLLVAVPLSLLVVLAARRSSLPGTVGTAFAVGLLSHPLADAIWPLLLGLHGEVGFLLWPAVYSPPYVGQKPLVPVDGVVVTTLWVELPLLAAALVAWWRDGMPGVRPVRERLGR